MAANLLTSLAIRAGGGAYASTHSVMTVSPSSNPSGHPPLVLPQVGWHQDAPFVSSFTSALCGRVSPEVFAQVLDDINTALVSSPRATAIKYGSGVAAILFKPGVCTVVGAVVGTGAHVAGALGRQTAVREAVEGANAQVFGPAGLSISIMSTEQLHELLRLTPPTAELLLSAPQAFQDSGYNTADEKEVEMPKPSKTQLKQLPRGLARLSPHANFTLPVDIDLGPAVYTHGGRTDGLSKLAAKGQETSTGCNERRGFKALNKEKRKAVEKLMGRALWLVVV